MRVSATNTVKKLYGQVEGDLDGQITVQVDVQEDLSGFDGEKWVVLSTANSFGGKNRVLGYTSMAGGVLCFLWAFLLVIRPKGQKISSEFSDDFE